MKITGLVFPYDDGNKKAGLKEVHKFLSELSPYSVYQPDFIAEKLKNCGYYVRVLPNNTGVEVAGHTFDLVQPDEGEPGIWSLTLARNLYTIMTGRICHTVSMGRGAEYRELLEEYEKLLTEQGNEYQGSQESNRRPTLRAADVAGTGRR